MKILLLILCLFLLRVSKRNFNWLFKKIELVHVLDSKNEVIKEASEIEEMFSDVDVSIKKEIFIKAAVFIAFSIYIMFYLLSTTLIYSKLVLGFSVVMIIYRTYSCIKGYKSINENSQNYNYIECNVIEKIFNSCELFFIVFVFVNLIILK